MGLGLHEWQVLWMWVVVTLTGFHYLSIYFLIGIHGTSAINKKHILSIFLSGAFAFVVLGQMPYLVYTDQYEAKRTLEIIYTTTIMVHNIPMFKLAMSIINSKRLT